MRHCFGLLIIIIIGLSTFSASAQSSWQWGRGNTGGLMDSWAAVADLYGNIYTAGISCSGDVYFDSVLVTYPFPAATNNNQVVICKYNSSGNIIWAKGIMAGGSQPINITTDQAGNLLMLGMFYDHITIDTFNLYADTVHDTNEYFIVKFDSGGNVRWAKTCCDANGSIFTNSTSDADFLSSGGIAVDFSGNVFITGNFNAVTTSIGSYTFTNHDPSGMSDDVFVAGYDSSGNLMWATSFGGNSNDDVFGITVASTGNVYVSGTFISDTLVVGPYTLTDNYGTQIALLAECSPAGVPIWAEAAGGAKGAYCGGLASDHAGNIFVTGSFGDSSIIFGTDTIYRTYPSGVPNLEVYLVKISDSNNVVWQKTIGSPTASLVGFCISRGNTEDGAVWVSGSWVSGGVVGPFIVDSANIDGNILYTPDSSTDPVFIAGYDMGGYVLGYSALQSGADDQNSIACDQLDNVYICADYQTLSGFTYFEVGPDLLPGDSAAGPSEMQYLAKYGISSPSNANHLKQVIPQYTICPNPANNELTVIATAKISSISITNLLGQTVYSCQYDAENVQIDITDLIAGVYFIKINEVYTKKFVKM